MTGLLCMTFFMLACGPDHAEGEQGTKAKTVERKVQTVQVEKPALRSFIAEVLITGTAEPNQRLVLYAMESGYVEKVSKDIGDFVRKGEIIATLINPELSRQLEIKEAQLHATKSIYERLKSSYDKTPALTPLQIVENAEVDYLIAKIAYETIEDRLSFLNIKAPFSGRVTKRYIDHGALVQSGLTETNPQRLFEIQEVSPIRLTVPLPESDIASVDKGMDALVTFPELSGESFHAKVSRTAGVLDPASKTMQVQIDIDNAKGKIKPGMYAKVLLQIGSRDGVLSLPITAQWMYQNQLFVLVVDQNNVVERIPLRKGLSSKDHFEVLNAEITDTSLVIIQGKGLVNEGQIVKPVLKGE